MIRLAALLLLVPAVAAAYSDRAFYDDPAVTGGAGGRYFTGARVDGYACSVCHTGATTDAFTIDPLPTTLEAGKRYDVVVRWTDPQKPHALHMELSNTSGAHPMVAIAAPAALPAESRCNQAANGMPAVYVIDAGARRIVGVDPCGASMVTASFVATGGPIELAIGAVLGDGSESAAGDATFERRITLGVAKAGPDGGCETAGGGELGVALALLGVLRARSRTAR